MRVLVSGASGAIGTRLVRQLRLDLLDRDAVIAAVVARKPHAIVHQATALSNLRDFKNFDRSFQQTNLLRLSGCRAVGVSGFAVTPQATLSNPPVS